MGPDAEYLGQSTNFDYSVDSKYKRQIFYESCKPFLPFLSLDDLEPDFSGIRPKLQEPGSPFKDYIIRNESLNGFPNYINLLGIESPGLTSSLAIGDYVSRIIEV